MNVNTAVFVCSYVSYQKFYFLASPENGDFLRRVSTFSLNLIIYIEVQQIAFTMYFQFTEGPFRMCIDGFLTHM